ncbi:MAG: permease [Spirochaetota bacterium]
MIEEYWLLITLVLGLCIGPILYALWPQKSDWYRVLDSFSVISIGGIALLHLFPEAISKAGPMAIVAAGVGFILPIASEKIASLQKKKSGFIVLILAIAIHIAIESSAVHKHESHSYLGLAIVLHRLPVGLVIFLSARSTGGNRLAYISIALLGLITLLSFFFGYSLFQAVGFSSALLEAFVAASLLHIVIEHKFALHGQDSHTCSHQHHNHYHQHDHSHNNIHNHDHSHKNQYSKKEIYLNSLGIFLGIILIIVIVEQPYFPQSSPESYSFLRTFFALALESAPALLLAYALASGFKGFLQVAQRAWLQTGNALQQSLKGVLFGLPLPICSCGVLPLYKTLIQQGLPTTAAVAFLIATPELGIDALLLSLPLLGGEFTLYRLLAAFVVAILTALLLTRLLRANEVVTVEPPKQQVDNRTLTEKAREGLRFGFVELFDHTMPWIVLGIFVAAIAEPLLDDRLLYNIPSVALVPILAVIGIPVYVCASGATPVAAILIHKGISPGAALAFLIAGPATNVTTFAVLGQLHSRRFAALFATIVASLAIVLGWFVDAMVFMEIKKLHDAPEAHPGYVQWMSFCCLAFLMLVSLIRQGPRGFIRQIVEPIH